MDVGNVGRQRDLIEKNPCYHGTIDGKHQAPAVLEHAEIHSAPESSNLGANYHMMEAEGAIILRVVPMNEGVKQCNPCPGRGAAFFTLLRRAGTQRCGSIMGPGSA